MSIIMSNKDVAQAITDMKGKLDDLHITDDGLQMIMTSMYMRGYYQGTLNTTDKVYDALFGPFVEK